MGRCTIIWYKGDRHKMRQCTDGLIYSFKKKHLKCFFIYSFLKTDINQWPEYSAYYTIMHITGP